jgi:hypothetical protein
MKWNWNSPHNFTAGRRSHTRRDTMTSEVKWGVFLGVLVVAGFFGWRIWREIEAQRPPPVAAAPAPAAPDRPADTLAPPVIEHPLRPADTAEPLPELRQSDPPLLTALAAAFGTATVEKFLIPKDLVRRLVALVDNLDRKPLPLRQWPLQRTPGAFDVERSEHGTVASDDNARRYAPWVGALEGADTGQLVALYRRYYPLFQEAYEELGYPQGYFNDRLVMVLDHLLATPDLPPAPLKRPKVLYLYADEALEARSWGQKTLLRMGPAHTAAVKAKLREIRDAVSVAAPDRAAVE